MASFSLRVLAAAMLALGLLAAPLLASHPTPAAPVSAATLAIKALRAARSMPVAFRLHPDNLLSRPDPTPSPTPPVAPTATPVPPPVAARPAPVRAVPPPAITAQAGVLLDADTGRILWARDARAARPIASIAKIFTAMVAIDLVPLDRVLPVPPSIASLPADSTMMGLHPGERLSVRELLDGALLVSGNDAAVTLAGSGSSQPAFIADMNALAARIGLRSTHFVNPVGLDSPGQYSSAMDLATAALFLDRHYPLLARLAATGEIDLPATATHGAYRLQNLDKLLWTYPGVDGLKGGYTELAGGCVLTTATLGGHHVVAVVLGSPPLPSPGAFADMRALLDYGAALFQR
ncbi:MAG TPA: D-alanyl-D-alanine carboxypeptidase family protein [Candidatus Limnocylindrales bacterium]|nr:D-alanyl-D-alanine carboxypeptidase family protein [Candidatus Limnocylindrales bacterium]